MRETQQIWKNHFVGINKTTMNDQKQFTAISGLIKWGSYELK